MPRSPLSQQMQSVVAYVAPLMKAHGFRKRSNTFNRSTEDGLVHVANFQMGPYEPIPPNLNVQDQIRHVAALTELRGYVSLYGSFTVNLGVFIPEMAEATQGRGVGLRPPIQPILAGLR